MSCTDATSPINIVTQNTDAECTSKCQYSFNYPRTGIWVTKKETYINFKPTKIANIGEAIYKEKDYIVKNMRLYKPSLHTYGGEKMDAELIIKHSNISGIGIDLMVCIPISKNGQFNSTLDDLIKNIGDYAPGNNSQVGLNRENFTLNDLVPYKPYYSYKGTLPYTPCTGNYHYVVFGKQDALGISVNTYNTLNNLIVDNDINISKSNEIKVFYNKNGPSKNKGEQGDDIYIECKPTGVSDNEVLVNMKETGGGVASVQNFLQSKAFSIIQAILVAFIVFAVLCTLARYMKKYLSKYESGNTSSSSSKTSG